MSSTDLRREGRGRGGALIPLGVVLLGIIEIVGLGLLGRATSVWWVLGVVLAGWVIAVALLVAAGQQSFVRLRSLVRAVRGRGDISEHMSRPAFTLVSALCFAFPGLLTDLIGLVLLIVPVQKRVARTVGLSAPQGARQVLFRRASGGIIEGEIVVDARRTDAGAHADTSEAARPGGSSAASPRIITQD